MKIVFLFCLSIFPLFVWAQSKETDSLHAVKKTFEKKTGFEKNTAYLNTLNLLADKSHTARADSAEIWARKSLALSRKSSYREGQADALRVIGLIHSRRAEYKEASERLEEGLKIARQQNYGLGIYHLQYAVAGNYNQQALAEKALEELKNSVETAEKINYRQGLGMSLNMIGNIYRFRGEYPIALDHALKAHKIFREIDYKWGIAWSLGSLAGIYSAQNNFEAALKTQEEILKLRKEAADIQGVAWTLNNIGTIYKSQKNYLPAIQKHRESLDVASKANISNHTIFTYNYANLAELYILKNDYGSAYRAMRLAEESNEKPAEKGIQVKIEELFARYFLHEKNYRDALRYARKALKIAREADYKESLSRVNEVLYLICKEQNRYDSALFFHEQFKLYGDSLNNAEIEERTANLTGKYEYEKREEKLKTDYERQTDRMNLLIISISIALAAGGLVLFFIFRSRKKIGLAYDQLKISNESVLEKSKEIREMHTALDAAYQVAQKTNKEITASISYAVRVQNAVLCTEADLHNHFDCFVFSRPRDIVSGDFYWQIDTGKSKILVVADCTGHGVSAAFMTVIGTNILNRITEDHRISGADEILNKIPALLEKTLMFSEGNLKDTMDISVLSVSQNEEGTEANWAGAMSSLYWVDNKKLHILKGDKVPLGESAKDFFRYKRHSVFGGKKPDGPVMLYLFTDGFQDQFGGERDRKFMITNFKSLLSEISELPLSEQKKQLGRVFDEWKGERKQTDDVLVVGVKL